MDLIFWVMAVLLIAGAVLALAGGVGVMRFPDFYTRMHAVGITDTLCSALILIALMVHFGLSLASLKVLLILVFLLFTCPTASHALARTARKNGVEPWRLPESGKVEAEKP